MSHRTPDPPLTDPDGLGADDQGPEAWVNSPCTGLCVLDTSSICTGCSRTLDEIVRWTGMDAEERRAVLTALGRRLRTAE